MQAPDMMGPKPTRGKKGGKKKKMRLRNTRKRGRKQPNKHLTKLLQPTDDDILKMLAAKVHVGRQRAHVNMKRYIWKRRPDGVHVINLQKTWHKIILAARIIVTVNDPNEVVVLSAREYGQRSVIKFCKYTKTQAAVGKWVPGTFTNPRNEKSYLEPRLVIVDDPQSNYPALRETSYVGIPVIALCGIDNNTKFVDCAIPCNNRGKYSLGLIFWLLAREIKRMKGELGRNTEWKIPVDLFFFRKPEEVEEERQAEKVAAGEDLPAEYYDPHSVMEHGMPPPEYQQDENDERWQFEMPEHGGHEWGFEVGGVPQPQQQQFQQQAAADYMYQQPMADAQFNTGDEQQQQQAPQQQQQYGFGTDNDQFAPTGHADW